MARKFDIVIVGATPGGITAAIAAAREGASVALLERSDHIGGLPANGLGATDIATRGATGGLFTEFVARIRAHYAQEYGESSEQLRDCSDGYHFEPSVAEKVFERMLGEQPGIAVLPRRQFEASVRSLAIRDRRVESIIVGERGSLAPEQFAADVFIDATYEGDLAAAAGAGFRTRREGRREYDEPCAGRIFKRWGSAPDELDPASTGEGDDTIQAYNYRLCLTDRPGNRVPIERPANYDRAEYASLVDDIRLDRAAGPHRNELEFDGIGRIVNLVRLPNGKTDANNQHLAFISTDLPEENYAWPTADWAWRDTFARRLRAYTLGLLYFAQNDAELPAEFRRKCARWGLARDEYADNGHFPRQVYVREGRRIEGEHLFTAHDALPVREGARPPVHATSITASHYAIDSHAHRKREPGRWHLDGFLSVRTRPYTVPLGVIVPRGIDNLLTPVAVSATHLGFGTLRMEPCWMAMGQAAGLAAVLSIRGRSTVRDINVARLQRQLLEQKAVLMHFVDVPASHRHYAAVQYFGVRGVLPEWEARPDDAMDERTARDWLAALGWRGDVPAVNGSRGAFLSALYAAGR